MRFKLLSLTFLSSLALNAQESESNTFPLGGDVSISYDNFRSLPDGSWNGNTGIAGSLNLSYCLPKQHQGFGLQWGASFGVYEWNGRGSTFSKDVALQTFVSVGLTRVTPKASGINAGVIYDWDINHNYGVFGLNPNISQIRAQIGYIWRARNEFGFMGSYGTSKAHENYGALPVTFKAVNQVNAFWRHIFKNKGETVIYAGTPYGNGLMYTSGRAGNFLVGFSFKAPLTDKLSLEAHGVYMGARGNVANVESRNYAANASIGITYAFGGTQIGARPYLPLANNSNFIVDTNSNY